MFESAGSLSSDVSVELKRDELDDCAQDYDSGSAYASVFSSTEEYSSHIYAEENSIWSRPLFLAQDDLWVSISNDSHYTYQRHPSASTSLDDICNRTEVENEEKYTEKRLSFNLEFRMATVFLQSLRDSFATSLHIHRPDHSLAYVVKMRKCAAKYWCLELPIEMKLYSDVLDVLLDVHFATDNHVDLLLSRFHIFQVRRYIQDDGRFCASKVDTFTGPAIRLRSHKCCGLETDQIPEIRTKIKEMIIMLQIYSPEVYISAPPRFPSVAYMLSREQNTAYFDSKRDESRSIKKTIHLKKHEVSFLMGLQGTRINHLRRTYGCAIKTSLSSFSQNVFLPLKNTPQEVMLCGPPQNVESAVNAINELLYRYREKNEY